MQKLLSALLFSSLMAAVVFANGPYPGGGGSGGGTSGTNFAGIYVTNTAYANNFVATSTGQTNIFDVTLFTNGVSAFTSSIDTNTAPVYTSSNPTNSYTVQTLYTNAGQRCLLIGSVVLPAQSVVNGSGCVIRYTNNSVGYALPISATHANGASGTAYVPFSIPMSVGSTFKVETNAANSAAVNITNVVCWRL